MAILLYLTDILEKTKMDLTEVLLIRHALSDGQCRKCYENSKMKEYTQIQKKKFPTKYKYWITFLSNGGTSAVLDKCYKVKGYQTGETNLVAEDFFDKEWFEKDGVCFDLEEIDLLSDLEGRLVIDWGKGARAWYQKALGTPKEVLAIQSKQKVSFTGYENLVLTYQDLKEIVEDNLTYADWHTALSSVYAIYLIVDKTDGKQYVGSAYGESGLLQRWSMYVNTKHGNNKEMRELICDYPERYENFQFSILQICPKNMMKDEVIHLESLYKKKLLSKEFGLNDN